jgi:hypothetical protein
MKFATIDSNTGNTITYHTHWQSSTNDMKIAANEAIEIRKVDHALDQPGRSGGALIKSHRTQPGNMIVMDIPAGWPPNDQVVEPCHAWNNTRTDGSGAPAPVEFRTGPGVVLGIHAKNEPPPATHPGVPAGGYTEYEWPHPLRALTEGGPTPSPTPIAPTNLQAVATSSSQVDLTWTDNSNDETRFRIERGPDGASFPDSVNKTANSTSHSDTGLTASTTYYYRVRAENETPTPDLVSLWSNLASATTNAPAVSPPPAPVATAATSITSNSFQANWNAATTATGYRVDVSTSNVFTSYIPTYEDRDVFDVLLFNVTGLNPTTTYYYRVQAYNAGGAGVESNVITVVTTTPPPSPSPPDKGAMGTERGER